MAESTRFMIGAEARCSDGVCGRVTQVVIDPIADEVTHLIVEPEHREGLGRLVPIGAVQPHGDQVDLGFTRAEFEELKSAETTQFFPGDEGYQGYDPGQMLLWPYYGGNITVPLIADTLPAGEVAIRRGDHVHALDGQIGQVEGLVVDARNHHVTHVLLKEGHLFSRKEVAIPLAAVTEVGPDGIRLSVDKRQVEDLPPVKFDRRSE